MTLQPNSAINLCLSMMILVVTACCSRSGDGGDSSLKPLGPFSPSECGECKAKAISGIPSNVICLEQSWEDIDGGRLWRRYYVRDKDLLLVSHKFGKFRWISLTMLGAPAGDTDPVVKISTAIVTTLELKDKVRTTSDLQLWVLKCVDLYLKGIGVDDIFTENEISFRFINYKGEVILDHAKADTMKNLTPSRED